MATRPRHRLAYRAIAARLDAELAVSRFVADQAGPACPRARPGHPRAPADGAHRPDDEPAPQIVLVAQRLEPEKDTDVALRAWAESGLGQRGWELHVAGAGIAGSRSAGAGPATRCRSGSIRFLGQRSDLAADLRAASILLAPTPSEAFGLTVVEAMARGVPVVAAAGGGHLETVGPVGHDLLFAPGDAARRVRPTPPPGRRPRGSERRSVTSCTRRFEAEYRIEHHAEQLESVYREVLGPSSGVLTAVPRRIDPGGGADHAGRRSVAFVFPGCDRDGGVERVVRELARRTAATHDVTFVGDRFDAEGMERRGIPAGRRSARLPGEPAAACRSAGGRRGSLDEQHFDLTVGFGVECPACDIAVVGSVHRAWLDISGPVHTPFVDLPARTRFVDAPPSGAARARTPVLRPHAHPSVLATSTSYGGGDHPHLRRAQRSGSRSCRTATTPTSSTQGSGPLTATPLRARLGVSDQVVLLFVGQRAASEGLLDPDRSRGSGRRPEDADRGRRARRPCHLP